MIQKPKGVTRAAVLRALGEYPSGIASDELAERVDISLSRVKKHLLALRNEGSVVWVGVPLCGFWCLPQYEAAVYAQCAEARAKAQARAAEKRKARDRRVKQVARDYAELRGDTWFEQMPVHRCVDALAAAPLGRVGVRSIFEAAA